jgi:hypothetical protein
MKTQKRVKIGNNSKGVVFSILSNNRVYKIVWFQFRGGFMNNEHTRVYPGSDPSVDVIALCPVN